MKRVYNFSPGPAMLPTAVLERMQAELLDWQGSGMSVMEVSHRGSAFIEFAGSTMANAAAAARVDRYADAIRKVGPQFCILSSDLGQAGNPLPPDGFADFLVAMRAKGFTQQEIDTMSKTNPARLLGLQ